MNINDVENIPLDIKNAYENRKNRFTGNVFPICEYKIDYRNVCIYVKPTYALETNDFTYTYLHNDLDNAYYPQNHTPNHVMEITKSLNEYQVYSMINGGGTDFYINEHWESTHRVAIAIMEEILFKYYEYALNNKDQTEIYGIEQLIHEFTRKELKHTLICEEK